MFERKFISVVDRVPPSLAGLFRSHSRFARFARPILNRFVSVDETVITVRSGGGAGLRLPIMPGSEKYYWSGTHEGHVQEALARELSAGMCFWDVGAHIGFFSCMASKLVGPQGQVISFEPMPETRARLRRSIDLNHLENVLVEEAALADISGIRTLSPPKPFDPSHDERANSLTPMWTVVSGKGEPGGFEVRCARIDDLVGTVSSPDLIKIDAEGAELEVLSGAMGLLSRRQTKVIIEMSDEDSTARGRKLLPDHRFEHLGANHWLIS